MGNVLATVSDKKFGVLSDTNSSLIDHYEPEIVGATDYYPFGMPSRVSLTGKGYRFGFNGKENDNDVKGWGNQQDYGMRIYDPRVGRFLSVDPLTKGFPMLTPYQFSSNSPMANVDLDGGEAKYYMVTIVNTYHGEKLVSTSVQTVQDKTKTAGLLPHGLAGAGYNFYTSPGPEGNGAKYTFFEENHYLKEGSSYFTNSPTYYLGEAYFPAAGDDGTRGGLRLVSSSGGYSHKSGSVDGADAIPIVIDFLVSVVGGFPSGGQETTLAKQFSQQKMLGEKMVKLLEALKFGQESASKENDIVNQLSDYVKDILKDLDNKKMTQEEKDKAFWKKFVGKGAVYYDRNTGLNIERNTDTSGQLTHKQAKDTLPEKE